MKSVFGVVYSVLVLALIPIAASAASPSYIYVNNNTSPNSVSAFSVAADGTLAPVAGSPFSTGANSNNCFSGAERATIVATGDRLYVSSSFATAATPGPAYVTGFSIDATTGVPTIIAGSPFLVEASAACSFAGRSSIALASTPDGKYLMVATNGRVHAFAIDSATGALDEIDGSPFSSRSSTTNMAVSPDGRFLTLAQAPLTGGWLQTFGVEGSGALSLASELPVSAVTSIDYGCDGLKAVTGTGAPTNNLLRLFNAGSDGALALAGSTPVQSLYLDAVWSVDDRFVFSSGGNNVVSYAISGNTFIFADSIPNPSGNALAPTPVAVSGDGRFLFTAATHQLNVFATGGDGTLSFLSSSGLPGTQGSVAAYPAKSCDAIAPVTSAVPSPAANPFGWNNTDVTMSLAATDDMSGVKEIHYTLTGAQTDSQTVSGSSASFVISAEGITEITFFAVDWAGNQESPQTYTVRIDKTSPALSCGVDKPELGPPNHALVPVTATVSVADGMSGPRDFGLVSATSNEAANATGDGNTATDIESVGDSITAFLLRAERAGSGTGRVYTLMYEGSDLAGNSSTCSATVRVAHDHHR